MSKLQNFDYQNVALKEGHWKKQRDELIETYLKIEDDDMLHPFRKLALLLSSNFLYCFFLFIKLCLCLPKLPIFSILLSN